jgi:tellurite resistance-related uncharacterized protein
MSRLLSGSEPDAGGQATMIIEPSDQVPVSEPYRTTAIFDETTLPVALRREHRTKAGAWGVIRVLEGEVAYTIIEPFDEQRLSADRPGLILPDQAHFVTPVGPMRMQVEFYDHLPVLVF